MTKIKIGIIGTGYMGGTHAQLYARDERTEVCAVYDIKPEVCSSSVFQTYGRGGSNS